jgi:hypothetical protein
MAIEYIRITDKPSIDKFLCGFATSRKVISELTYPIYVDDNSVFYFAFLHENVIGFCSAKLTNKKIIFCHDYVINEYRNKGIYNKLFNMRLNDYVNKELYAVCTKKSISTFLRFGFCVIKKTNKYSFVTFKNQTT